MDLIESSFDLMSNPLFTMTQRASWMMPKPFVLTDAIVIQQKIKPSENKTIPENSMTIPTFDLKNDSIVQVVDTVKVK